MSSYFKGILIGMSIVIGSLILMGYTSSGSEVGRYQIIQGGHQFPDGSILESIWKIDTKTGYVSSLEKKTDNVHSYYWWQYPNETFISGK